MTHERTAPTCVVTLWMAGDATTAKAWLRRHCTKVGLCVTVTETEFVYRGGHEAGFAVGLVNYPRFPAAPEELFARAEEIALGLLDECGQDSALVVTQKDTRWITRREGSL